jgi:hypothetical protein
MGRDHSPQPDQTKPDGTLYTHNALLKLGKDLMLRSKRIGCELKEWMVKEAFYAWFNTALESGRLRGTEEEYLEELRVSLRGCEGKAWFIRSVNKWLRWISDRDFPKEGMGCEKILFAVTRHCSEEGKKEFYLGARDAATLIGASHMSAWRCLNALVRMGFLAKVGQREVPRDSQTYRLLVPYTARFAP